MKAMLHRIVAMLTRMAMRFDGVAESSTKYHADIDYECEHRFAEHEHDTKTEETPEPSRGVIGGHNTFAQLVVGEQDLWEQD